MRVIMARRRNNSGSSRRSGDFERGKSNSEARAERVTWALLVLVFAVTQLLPEGSFPNWMIPGAGAVVLLGSGIYQYSRRWRVSPVTWIGGVVMALLAFYSYQTGFSYLGETLVVFAAVILVGVLTGET
jgi:hypothetical protein